MNCVCGKECEESDRTHKCKGRGREFQLYVVGENIDMWVIGDENLILRKK